MRVDNFSPRTWLLAGVAGWAVCLWVFALAGLGARIGTGEDAADPQPLPSTTIPRADRPGPQAQYAEIASRPIFSETRKPQPFVIDGAGQEAQANTFDFTLTSVLIAGDVQVAILKPAADGAQPVRVKLGDALETAPQWSLASLQPRGAVFRGPDGEKTLELRVFNGVGGVAPTPAAPAPPPPPVINETIGPPVQPGPGQPVAPPVQPPPTEPVSAQVQLEAIRKRIEARRAQLRQQNAQEAPNPGPRRDRPLENSMMTLRSTVHVSVAAALCAMLAACASAPSPMVQRSPARPADRAAAAPAPGATDGVRSEPLDEAPTEDGRPRAQIRRGNGRVINSAAATAPLPDIGATSGEARFNFEGESLHAVVKVILGDMLGQNYTIAPNVQGTVTYSTPKPVSAAQALSVLEMILGWNNARMIYGDGRYSIVPADQALATGVVTPRGGSPENARGFESRVVPLRYISATEMEKLLKPYARPNAIVTVDSGRNLLTVAGTRAELENYLRTVEIFDVDWMASMSVGVYPLQSSKAAKVVQDLEKVFGEQSKSPVAGMFRFMPLEGANAVLAITSQADYLDDIEQWIDRIDGAGEGVKLYSYELKYITAKDLADRLSEVFGGGSRSSGGNDGGGFSLIPGGQSNTIGGKDSSNSAGDFGSTGGSSGSGGLGGGGLSLSPAQGGSGSVVIEVGGDKVAVSAIEQNNTLLVRSTGSAWRSIVDVIEKLDVLPLQVHIESQVAEVTLSGELSYGVNWFLENATTENNLPDVSSGGLIPAKWSTLGASIGGASGPGLAWTLIKNDAAAVITALDRVTDVRLLQTGSVLAKNNSEATLNVGSRIPVTSVSVNPILGNNNSISQVQYLDTGVILKVRPRVTKDGTVFLDIVQEVSSPGSDPDVNGNVRINTRRLKTEAIANSGDTVLLAGLIQDGTTRGSSGLPGLTRIPVLGALFGRQSSNQDRTEVVILLTATIVRNQQELRSLTDDYSRRFRAMEPLRPPATVKPVPPQPHR